MVSDDAIAAARHSGASDLFVAFVRRADDHELARDLEERYEASPNDVGRVATDAFGRAVWTGEFDEARRRADETERAVLDDVGEESDELNPDAEHYGATRDGEAMDEAPRDDPENHDAP
jgi:hypothetical protein